MRLLHHAVFAAIVLLAGCATVTPEEQRAKDEETCRDYGFRKGSEAFAGCLLDLELDRRAERRALMDDMRWREPAVIYRPVLVRPRPAP